METAQKVGWTGVICLALALALLACSAPMRCPSDAAHIGGFALLDGAALGTALALITRTRRPAPIYLLLLAAGATLWPLLKGWPYPQSLNLLAPPEWLERQLNYLEILRYSLYLLAALPLFGLLGFHASDTPPSGEA